MYMRATIDEVRVTDSAVRAVESAGGNGGRCGVKWCGAGSKRGCWATEACWAPACWPPLRLPGPRLRPPSPADRSSLLPPLPPTHSTLETTTRSTPITWKILIRSVRMFHECYPEQWNSRHSTGVFRIVKHRDVNCRLQQTEENFWPSGRCFQNLALVFTGCIIKFTRHIMVSRANMEVGYWIEN